MNAYSFPRHSAVAQCASHCACAWESIATHRIHSRYIYFGIEKKEREHVGDLLVEPRPVALCHSMHRTLGTATHVFHHPCALDHQLRFGWEKLSSECVWVCGQWAENAGRKNVFMLQNSIGINFFLNDSIQSRFTLKRVQLISSFSKTSHFFFNNRRVNCPLHSACKLLANGQTKGADKLTERGKKKSRWFLSLFFIVPLLLYFSCVQHSLKGVDVYGLISWISGCWVP